MSVDVLYKCYSLLKYPYTDRYKKMIYDLLLSTCGREFVESLPETSYHRPPRYQPFQASYNEQQVMGYTLVAS